MNSYFTCMFLLPMAWHAKECYRRSYFLYKTLQFTIIYLVNMWCMIVSCNWFWSFSFILYMISKIRRSCFPCLWRQTRMRGESPYFLPASPKAKAGLGVQSLRPSVRPSVPKSCHRNSSETTDPIIMKLGMWIGHHMLLCISAGNFDPLIFVGVMPLGT